MMCPAIAGLITAFCAAGEDAVFWSRHAELYEDVRDFFVAEEGAMRGGSELRGGGVGNSVGGFGGSSLAGRGGDAAQGKGLGKALVNATVEEARRLLIRRVFALTYEQAFFEKLGFQWWWRSRRRLPLKVWSVCIYVSEAGWRAMRSRW